jgi:hypothetical protein
VAEMEEVGLFCLLPSAHCFNRLMERGSGGARGS